DPFKAIKEESNNNAMKLMSRAKKILEESEEPFFDAIRIAISGNISYYGIKSDYNRSETLEGVMGKKPFINDYRLLKEKLSKAKNICFLADNAGEIILDKLLIEQINQMFKIDKINLIVKKYPFMNDVILEDLEEIGFEEIVNVEIVALENLTSNYYVNLIEPYIEQADVVIAKGQGNFELLYDKKLSIFFLFIIKCEMIKDILKSEKEDVIVAYN
ncbi:MAG: ARMT1-like domain-containing protein, partial [Candidatus Heimdallarchaeaceae archaeon]